MKNNIINKRFKSERVKTARRRKVSSTKWLQRQLNDPFVLIAKENGYRCRAAFKIIEIEDKFKIFKKGYKVLDLGSAPGAWSQIIVKKVGLDNIVAVDILEMEPINGVKFIQQDFLAQEARNIILKKSNIEKYDVIMSDMAANTTGDKKTDHLRTANLVEEALDFALGVLKTSGCFISKVFQGSTEKEFLEKIKKNFKSFKHFKPQSSRKDSVEKYIVATGFIGNKKEQNIN